MALAIITGGSLGLGYQTAIGLASGGYDLVITSRADSRGQRANRALTNLFPERSIIYLPLDLSRLESIEVFVAEFAKLGRVWDVLVNNAGAKVLREFHESDFGCEYHYGVNAVGHFALTSDLMALRSRSARVVTVSSIVSRFAPKRLGPTGTPSNYSPGASYAASKLSNLLFALELERRYGSTNFSSVAAHPGFAKAEPYGSKFTNLAERLLAQSARSGAKPILAAATDSMSGPYLAPRWLQLWGAPSSAKLPRLVTVENQKRNWEILSDLSGREL